MPVEQDGVGRQTAFRGQLLAMPGLRRSVESQPVNWRSATLVAAVNTRSRDVSTVIHDLVELIEAIDRRLPQVQRDGEAAIANAALRLRIAATNRIAELQRGDASEPRP